MIALVLLTTSAVGQISLDVNSFVLGVLGERQIIKEELTDRNKVDEFFFTEYEIMDFIDSLVQIENDKTHKGITTYKTVTEDSNCEICSKSYFFYSESLAESIHKNTRLRFSKSWAEPNSKKIYLTDVKESSIKSTGQKISFIVGAFIRFGAFKGNTCSIELHKTTRKFKLIEKTLKDLECEITGKDIEQMREVESGKRYVGKLTIEFIPSMTLEMQLSKIRAMKSRLTQKWNTFLQRPE